MSWKSFLVLLTIPLNPSSPYTIATWLCFVLSEFYALIGLRKQNIELLHLNSLPNLHNKRVIWILSNSAQKPPEKKDLDSIFILALRLMRLALPATRWILFVVYNNVVKFILNEKVFVGMLCHWITFLLRSFRPYASHFIIILGPKEKKGIQKIQFQPNIVVMVRWIEVKFHFRFVFVLLHCISIYTYNNKRNRTWWIGTGAPTTRVDERKKKHIKCAERGCS